MIINVDLSACFKYASTFYNLKKCLLSAFVFLIVHKLLIFIGFLSDATLD